MCVCIFEIKTYQILVNYEYFFYEYVIIIEQIKNLFFSICYINNSLVVDASMFLL